MAYQREVVCVSLFVFGGFASEQQLADSDSIEILYFARSTKRYRKSGRKPLISSAPPYPFGQAFIKDSSRIFLGS